MAALMAIYGAYSENVHAYFYVSSNVRDLYPGRLDSNRLPKCPEIVSSLLGHEEQLPRTLYQRLGRDRTNQVSVGHAAGEHHPTRLCDAPAPRAGA